MCGVPFHGKHSQANLCRHMKSGHGGSSYACEVPSCGRSYRRKDALQVHLRKQHPSLASYTVPRPARRRACRSPSTKLAPHNEGYGLNIANSGPSLPGNVPTSRKIGFAGRSDLEGSQRQDAGTSDVLSSDESSISDRQTPPSAMNLSKEQLLKRLMDCFNAMFRTFWLNRGYKGCFVTAGSWSHHPEDGTDVKYQFSTERENSKVSSKGEQILCPNNAKGKGKGKRQRCDKDNDQSQDDDGKGHSEEEEGSGCSRGSSRGRMFACPYYQRDPAMHRTRRSCVGPGFAEVRRVKYAPLISMSSHSH